MKGENYEHYSEIMYDTVMVISRINMVLYGFPGRKGVFIQYGKLVDPDTGLARPTGFYVDSMTEQRYLLLIRDQLTQMFNRSDFDNLRAFKHFLIN